jgi:hypothetical protein
MTANSYMGLAKEATYSTAASVSLYTPVSGPKLTPTLKWINDPDFRGSPVGSYDQVPGVRNDDYDGKVFMYADVYPNLLMGILGGPDTVASVGSNYSHTIGVLNSASTGSQPPSYTIINNSVNATYQITGARAVDLSVAFTSDAAVETTLKYEGNISTTVSAPTINETTAHLVPAWSCAASIGGASVAVIESGTLDIKRGTAPIFTLGQQGPYNNFMGPIDVTGTLVFVMEAGETNYANALQRDQQQLLLQFTDPASSDTILFQMDAIQLTDPVIEQSKSFISLNTKFTAVATTVDQTSGGYSPIKTVTTNGVSTAY